MSVLSYSTILDVYSGSIRVFEGGGSYRGAFLDLTRCTAGVASELALRSDITPSVQIQPVSASVFNNALTITLRATTLDFRSAYLTSGAVNTRTVGSTSVTVPSGATLGTTSAVASRLVILAIDNAGTVELAITNLSGAPNLDETTLISTTAISTAADNTGVIYSTTARTNAPFRVVGFVDITEATAGTWAAAPTKVQGCGGQAFASMSSLGYGQALQNVTGSRGLSTTYYNTTGKPILVMCVASSTAGTVLYGVLDGSNVCADSAASGGINVSVFIMVPPGASYMITGSVTITLWSELR